MNKTFNYSDLSILVVEDEETARHSLKSMLELDFKYVYEAKDGCEGLELYLKHKPDVVVTDIQMPCMNGLDLLNEIRKIQTQSIIVFISAYNDVDYLLQAIDLKVDAYVIKPFSYKDLLEKISTNLGVNTKQVKLYDKLSKREKEVFIDIAKGIKPIDIANKYKLKAKTVGTYRKRILEKLGMINNAELIKYAVQQDII